MFGLAPFFGFLLILFVVSAALSWLFFSFVRAAVQAPPTNTRLFLRRGGSVFLCHVIGQDGRSWRLTAPILRSEVVPLRPHDRFLAEYETSSGIARFFTNILSREFSNSREIRIEAPSRIRVIERRVAHRARFNPGMPVFSENRLFGELTNASRYGGTLRTLTPLYPGDDFCFTLTGVSTVVPSTVLECHETQGRLPGYVCRLRFGRELTDSEWSNLTHHGQIVLHP